VRRMAAVAGLVLALVGWGPTGAAGAQAPAPTPRDTCPPPAYGADAVVHLAYATVLGRCPDPPGRAAWVALLARGTGPGTLVRRMAATDEAVGLVVDDAYRTVLGRAADPEGRRFWTARLQARARHDLLLAELAASDELWVAAGATPAGFVDGVYEAVLHRPADPGGRSYWMARLAGGAPRWAVTRALARLPEPARTVVAAAYRHLLDRPVAPAELRVEGPRLQRDGDLAGLWARLAGTGELYARAQGLVPPPRPGRYVALGDSYVAGEGVAPFHAGIGPPPGPGAPPGSARPDGCGRSFASYPEVARATSAAVPGSLDLVACGGATVWSMYPAVPPDGGDGETGQLGALASGPPPDLVTLTVGGNDIGFVSLISACLDVRVAGVQVNLEYGAANCEGAIDEAMATVEALAREAGGAPGPGDEDDGESPCGGGPCTLPRLVSDVRAAARGATVAVVGYPQLLPATGRDCSGPLRFADGSDAFGGRWRFAPASVGRSRALVTALNRALQDAAEGAGALYVDPTGRVAGHSVCDTDPYVNGLHITSGLDVASMSFHPNAAGHRALAAALADALDG